MVLPTPGLAAKVENPNPHRVASAAIPIPIHRPFLSAAHKRQRDKDKPCTTCNLEAWEATHYQMFVSGWTVTSDGASKPLFAHTNFAWLRSHSLANFVVRHEDKLVVVSGDGP